MMQCKAKSENLAHILGYQFWAVTAIAPLPSPPLFDAPEDRHLMTVDVAQHHLLNYLPVPANWLPNVGNVQVAPLLTGQMMSTTRFYYCRFYWASKHRGL